MSFKSREGPPRDWYPCVLWSYMEAACPAKNCHIISFIIYIVQYYPTFDTSQKIFCYIIYQLRFLMGLWKWHGVLLVRGSHRMERDSGASQPNGPDQVLEPSDPQEFFLETRPGVANPLRIGDSIGKCLLLGLASGIWKITIFNGKIHYKWPFSIANYQRVAAFMVTSCRLFTGPLVIWVDVGMSGCRDVRLCHSKMLQNPIKNPQKIIIFWIYWATNPITVYPQ